jgi:hypothetical protein
MLDVPASSSWFLDLQGSYVKKTILRTGGRWGCLSSGPLEVMYKRPVEQEFPR